MLLAVLCALCVLCGKLFAVELSPSYSVRCGVSSGGSLSDWLTSIGGVSSKSSRNGPGGIMGTKVRGSGGASEAGCEGGHGS